MFFLFWFVASEFSLASLRFLASEILRDYWLSGVCIADVFRASSFVLTTLDLALRSKLEFPLERAHSKVADFVARHHILYWRLGLNAARFDAL